MSRFKKANYFKTFIDESNTSSQSLWRKLDPYLNPNKKNPILSTIKIDNKCVNNKKDLLFHFSKVFTVSHDYKSIFVHDFPLISESLSFIHKTLDPVRNILLEKSTLPFSFAVIHPEAVEIALLKLKDNSSAGSIGIPVSVFKHCYKQLSYPLASLFNNCINTGSFPNDWKIAQVTPVYKGKGSKSDINNYRPIAVLPPIVKLFESILAANITDYFERNNLFHQSQFGFRKFLSCEVALTSLIESWLDNIENKKIVLSIFIDLKKAFDTVDHELLIAKLASYGFSAQAIQLLLSYLEYRFFHIKIDGTLSNPIPFKIGVPQGSVLGPLLFIIFINDIGSIKLHSELCLFADDSTLTSGNENHETLFKHVDEDLLLVNEWINFNRLLMNWSKTNGMALNVPKYSKLNIASDFRFNDKIINLVSNVKLLGVHLDNKLDFRIHCDTICKRVNSKLFCLNKHSYLFTEEFKIILFKLFILPIFDYCSVLFITTNRINYQKISKAFMKSVKSLLKIDLRNQLLSSQSKLLEPFNISPLILRIFSHYCTFTFNIFTRNNVPSISRYLHESQHIMSMRNHYSIIKFKSNHKKFSFSIIAAKLLNEFIHNLIISKTNISSFKTLMLVNSYSYYDKLHIIFGHNESYFVS
jgi:hypothetical protein